MNLSRSIKWLFYKGTSLPSRMVGVGLAVHKWVRELREESLDPDEHQVQITTYRRPFKDSYYL